MIKLEGNVLHVGELMINIPMSLKYKDLSENEWKLFFECVLEQQDQLAKANERVAELERQVKGVAGLFNDAVDTCYELREARDKFAIEQKIEVLESLSLNPNNESEDRVVAVIDERIEQLRKE